MIRTLARADKGKGVKLHVWPVSGGFQANVSAIADKDRWAVSTKRKSLDAMEEALQSKVSTLNL